MPQSKYPELYRAIGEVAHTRLKLLGRTALNWLRKQNAELEVNSLFFESENFGYGSGMASILQRQRARRKRGRE
jgi:hypothetical protein